MNFGKLALEGNSLFRGNGSATPPFYSPANKIKSLLAAGGHGATFVGANLAFPGDVPVPATGGKTLVGPNSLTSSMSALVNLAPNSIVIEIGTNFLSTPNGDPNAGTDWTTYANSLASQLPAATRYFICAPVNLDWFHQPSLTLLRNSMKAWCAASPTTRFYMDLAESGIGTGDGPNFIGDGTHWSSAGADIVGTFIYSKMIALSTIAASVLQTLPSVTLLSTGGTSSAPTPAPTPTPSPSPTPSTAEVPRLRRRYAADGNINLEKRYGTAAGPQPPPPPPPADFDLQLVIYPARVQPGIGALVRLTVTKNDVAQDNLRVVFVTDDASVGLVADELFTDASGIAEFTMIGASAGVANIAARIEVDGVLYQSNSVPFTVSTAPTPPNFNSTGLGRVQISSESPFAFATVAQVERLSHQEQLRKYPGDLGLQFASELEQGMTVVFLPWFLRK